MDDLATSFPSINEALLERQNINTILQGGKFSVKGWHSKSAQVDEFPESIKTDILGHLWNKSTTEFRPNFDIDLIQIPVTKRSILSAVSKLWDPTGIFAPLSLKLQLLLQSFWQQHVSWDEELPSSIYTVFMQHIKEIQDHQDFQILRRLAPDHAHKLAELQEFCDAREQA